MNARANNYTAYSVGCAAVWAVILLVGRRVADAETRKTMQLSCAAWWSGWTSATIARVAYPPPRELGPKGQTALQVTSVPMIALGVGSAIRFLWAGRKRR
jgi:drug/metabolite transporter (DMT)-like permease